MRGPRQALCVCGAFSSMPKRSNPAGPRQVPHTRHFALDSTHAWPAWPKGAAFSKGSWRVAGYGYDSRLWGAVQSHYRVRQMPTWTGAAATWTRRKREPRIDVSCAMPSSAAFRVAASAENVWISVLMTASGFGCCAMVLCSVQAAALSLVFVCLLSDRTRMVRLQQRCCKLLLPH